MGTIQKIQNFKKTEISNGKTREQLFKAQISYQSKYKKQVKILSRFKTQI